MGWRLPRCQVFGYSERKPFPEIAGANSPVLSAVAGVFQKRHPVARRIGRHRGPQFFRQLWSHPQRTIRIIARGAWLIFEDPMSFPATRHSFIQRLALAGTNDDWRQFVEDYWQPVCRFAARWGRLHSEDAEDVAAATFQVLITGPLLQRWLQHPTAKLRTLLCAVVRKLLANRGRIDLGRQRLLRDNRELLPDLVVTSNDGGDPAASEPLDAFYAIWAEELLLNVVRSLHTELLKSGRADQFRVLFGRVCEEMTILEIAECLGLTVTTAENYFRRTKQRLSERLEEALRRHVTCYCPADDLESELQSEWHRLGEFLSQHGGIERAIRESVQDLDAAEFRKRSSTMMQSVLLTLTGEKVPDQKTSRGTPG